MKERKITILDYYDSVKFLKSVEPTLYSNIKKIHKMKSEKCKWTNSKIYYPNKNKKFLESKSGYYYKLQVGFDKIYLKKQYSNNPKLNSGDPLLEIGTNETTDNVLISIPNTIIHKEFEKTRIFKVYELGNKNYKLFMEGSMVLLYNYFDIKIETFDLSTEVESQVRSLLETTNHSAKSIINVCMENDITEPTEENLFYLKLLLSD